MDDWPRYRIVSSLSYRDLEAKVKKLVREGWHVVGEPGVAKSTRDTEPPYFTQTMVRHKAPRKRRRKNPPPA